MPIGIAEGLAAISAAMQAVDFYEKHGGTRGQFIQTLDLRYQPTQYEAAENRIVETLGESTKAVAEAVLSKVQQCVKAFTDAFVEDDRELERERFGKSLRACVCRNIQILKDAWGDNIPDELKKEWELYRCKDFGGSSDSGSGRGKGTSAKPEAAYERPPVTA